MQPGSVTAQPISDPAPDELFAGRYALLDALGRGSFASVRRARDTRTGRLVAIKSLLPAASQDALTARIGDFREEIRLCSSVRHRGIASLLDAGETEDGLPFAVFELIEGPSLRERLVQQPPLSFEHALRILAELLEALAAVHAAGIVHRDIKPENVLLASQGSLDHPVLVDFGFGVRSGEGSRSTEGFLGTPRYAAPEQLRGEAPTPRSDLYSWGLLAIDCLSGVPLADGGSAHAAVNAQLDDRAVSIPEDLDRFPISDLLRRVTAKDPARRPLDASAALEELRACCSDLVAFDASEPAAPEKVKRRLTVVSCRFAEGETAALAREAEACIRWFRRCGATLVAAFGQRAVFAFGLRHDDAQHAEHAAEAAVQWLEKESFASRTASLTCSIGMHSGEALVDSASGAAAPSPALFGEPGSSALELDMAAPGRRIYLSAAARELLEGRWITGDAIERATPAGTALKAYPLKRRGSCLSASRDVEGPFAGREKEAAALAAAWQDARSGKARAVLVQGEAGLGKSRLLRELRAAHTGVEWLQVACTAEAQARPNAVAAQLLAALGSSASALAARYGLDAENAVPIFSFLLGETIPAGYAMPVATPDRLKQLTHGLMLELLAKLPADEALVVVVEDLQWADAASIELLSRLVEKLPTLEGEGARLLLLLNARPDFQNPWRESEVTHLPLEALSAEEVEILITARAGRDGLDADTIRSAAAACRGIPLFAEEAAFLLESEDETAGQMAMPSSSDELLQARMRSLRPSTLQILGTAAAIGQEFRSDIVAAVSRASKGAVADAVAEAKRAGLLVPVDEARGLFAFRHALLAVAAYETIAGQSRAALHLRIATVVQERFPELAMERPADIALHFEKGADGLSAAALWHQAGTAAMATASYLESQKHFERGIRIVRTAPPTLLRAQRELGLITGLATAHLSVQGYGAVETRENFAKARLLCTELGLEAPLQVLGGIFGVSLVTSDNEGMASFLSSFEALSKRTDSPAHAVAGHQMLGVHACWSGRYRAARMHTSAAMEIYRKPWVRDTSWEFGFGLYCYAYGMMAEFQMGYPDRAEEIRLEMLQLGGESRNPYTMALALGFSTTLTKDTGRPHATMELATRLLAMSAEQHLYTWYAFGILAQGSALMQLGQSQDGLAQIRSGLSMLETFGFHCSLASYQTYLVEALLACGELDEALEVADKGLVTFREHWTRFSEPDLMRLRGEVLAARGDSEGAEQEYRRALATARADEGVTFELRAANTLAELLIRRGDRASALAELEPVYSKYTEGFGTADVMRASRLMSELRKS